MKKKLNKGFTLTEMIVVISIIGILAAVLIPTVIGYIRKANMSADQQAVQQMNKILSIEEIENIPTTISEVQQIFSGMDFDIEDYKPLTKGTSFYWVVEVNKIIQVKTNTKEVIYPTNLKNLPAYSETAWIPLYTEQPEIDLTCTHELEYLEDITYLTLNNKSYEPTCNEEGIVEKAHCTKCGQWVSNIYVGTKEHDNKATLYNYNLFGTIYDEITFTTSYCSDCGLPVAFVEQETYNLSGENPWDVTYTFKPFSTEKIVAKQAGQDVTLEYSVFDLMYSKGMLADAEELYSAGNLQQIDPLVLSVFGVKINENDLGATKFFEKGVTFSIGFNVDVEYGDFAIGGYYESFGTVLDDLSGEINAYEDFEIDILSDFVSYGFGKTHSVLASVIEFQCGFTNIKIDVNENTPIYATVKLLIESDIEGEYDVISVFRHRVTKPYAYEAKEEYEKLNDNNSIYKVIAEDGKVYYATGGDIYDVNFLIEENVATFNEDGSVIYDDRTYNPSEKNYASEGSNIKIYKME